MKWPKRKPKLTPEEEYIAKLNREAKARELSPPTTPFLYIPKGYGISMIEAGNIISGTLNADRISISSEGISGPNFNLPSNPDQQIRLIP